MRYTDLTEEQLAESFEKVAGDFYRLIEDNGLEETEVYMSMGADNRKPDLNLCDTPACHGGWAAIMYGSTVHQRHSAFYLYGADLLAKKLGFEGDCHLQLWADGYPEYWGNDKGYLMFYNRNAFSKSSYGSILHLKDIANWYMDVAKRLRGG